MTPETPKLPGATDYADDSALTTFLANIYKAANDRETVLIGGGEFNPQELRTVHGAILTLIAKAK